MPFGLRNALAVFTAMMYDFKQSWDELSKKHGMEPDRSNNTTIIIDDVMVFGTSVDNMFILLECICRIARKYHLSWKLKKCQWFPKKI